MTDPNIALLSVAATDRKDVKARWSNYGAKTVDLGAPGVGVLFVDFLRDLVGLHVNGSAELMSPAEFDARFPGVTENLRWAAATIALVHAFAGHEQVDVFGAKRYAVRVRVLPEALSSRNIGLDELSAALRSANGGTRSSMTFKR